MKMNCIGFDSKKRRFFPFNRACDFNKSLRNYLSQMHAQFSARLCKSSVSLNKGVKLATNNNFKEKFFDKKD